MTKASEEIAAAKRYVLNQVAGLRVYDGIKARLDALEAALAGAEGGEWTDADRHAAYRAVADCHSDGERELDAYAFAALDAVAYRLAPSAREWRNEDGGIAELLTRAANYIRDHADNTNLRDQLRDAAEHFATRPTASEADEFWQGVKRSAAQVEGLPAWSGAGVRDHHDKPAASGALTEHERRCFDRVFEAAGLSDDSAPAAMRDAARSAYERIAGVRPTASEAQEPAQPADREASLQALGFEPLTDEQRANNILVNLGCAVQPAERDLALELFGDFRPAERDADVLTQYEKRCVKRVFEAAGLMDDVAPVKMVDVAFDALSRLASELAKKREGARDREAYLVNRRKLLEQRGRELEAELAKERERAEKLTADLSVQQLIAKEAGELCSRHKRLRAELEATPAAERAAVREVVAKMRAYANRWDSPENRRVDDFADQLVAAIGGGK